MFSYKGVSSKTVPREKNDYYPTPPIAVDALLSKSSPPKNILEPASGRGWVSKRLDEYGYNVMSRDLFHYDNPLVDIETGIDFTTSPKIDGIDGVITNPPYKQGYPLKFAQHSVSMYDYTALFCRLSWLETTPRRLFFEEYPFTNLIVMSNRVHTNERYFKTLATQVGGMVLYAWYVWDKRSSDKMIVKFADVKEILKEKQSNLEEFL